MRRVSAASQRILLPIRTPSGRHRCVCQASETAATLIGHAGRVNCVKWSTSLSGVRDEAPAVLASGSADGAVILWSIDLADQQQPWRTAAVLQVL